MKLFRKFTKDDFILTGCIATIGNFDGVHLGHQSILKVMVEEAAKKNLPAILITFDPMPAEFFLQDNAPARLTKLREKFNALIPFKLAAIVVLSFNHELSCQLPEAFIEKYLIEHCNIKHLFVGQDFKFGKNRAGNVDLLKKYENNFSLTLMSDVYHAVLNHKRISSSLIRDVLIKGNLALAKSYLGRPYSMIGRVVHGHKRGRTIGFPTANILLHRKKSPLLGVYAVKIHGLEKTLYGVANVGNRPTVDSSLRTVLEVHIFNYNEDIYGRLLEVEFIEKIRDEKRFDSFELLKKQILDDVVIAKEIIEKIF
jgi:riboflavin kinase/FMN adenylyltransferase